ncbi:MAG TPA: DUF3300 domain-containing protein [Thiobacillus sp.]|jgi:hypothetical protein|nr:DUF3300 domain-containing protein [Thiobacillus sp.]
MGILFRLGRLSGFFKALLVMITVATMLPMQQVSAANADSATDVQVPISQERFDSLLAPIALYPDQLLTQTLMASTYPLDVVEAARFVKGNRGLKGEELDNVVAEKNWDPSVQSLTAFPQVLEMMSDNLEWTQELGNAFLSDEKRVLQTVQDLRQKAEVAGNLKSDDEMKVVKQQSVIIIEPASPNVVYVPTYNPTVVYGVWWAPAYPPYYWPPPVYYYPPGAMISAGLIGFGLGIMISNNHWGWSNAGWHSGSININRNRNNTFINNNARFRNNVSNGNWKHSPSQRKGVAYGDVRTRDQYRKSDPNAVSSRRDTRGFESSAGTRGAQRPDRGGSVSTRNAQRPDRGGGSKFGGGAGTRDAQRPDRGGSVSTRNAQRPDRGGDSTFDGSIGTRDTQRSFGRSSGASPSFNAGHSRQQTQDYSNRGASSRSTMGRNGGYSGGGGRSGGGRSGGRGR